jgi:bifunctional UDP-N-acetylglucosamine pyrophosphorylase/glucosamine-1-phosphate N-acetyltransferase
VVLGYEAKKVKEKIESLFKDIRFHFQDIKNHPGTGGALRDIEIKKERVLVLNGDMPLIKSNDLKKFLEPKADIIMSVIELSNPESYGRVIIKANKIEKIVEYKDATKEELKINSVNAGVYLINTEILKKFLPKLSNENVQKEYYLTDIIHLAVKNSFSVFPLFVDEKNFKGVNSKTELSQAEEIMQKRIKERWMQEGVIFRLPQTIYIEESVVFKDECEIESGCVIKGKTTIQNSHIKANSIIEDSIIKNSAIGPLARIRPKSIIEDTHIGNFVEVKKSKLTGVKAGHLSYLGDSEVKEGTNIGAGTITCNYDGKEKHKTKIGKNVFIGSDTQLIAPVIIEDNVIIAAGTTVSKNIPKDALAINRHPLKIVKNFYYKFFGKKK